MTTIQTQAQRGTFTQSSTVRGVKGFVIGFVALAAAATGVGFAVSGTEAPSTVIAPVSHTAPNSEQREAIKRIQEQGTGVVTAPESEAVWSYPGKPGIR
jgi:hypothetical protein